MPECFVIAPIGLEGSPTGDRSDKILNHVIKPIAKECGFDAVRADKISEPGLITSQVIDHVLNDPMVVADLTGNNANVFYELAIRHATGKPYVQLIQKGEPIPFDVAGVRTVEIDHTNLDSVANAKEEIKKQMLFTTENPTKIESPISVAIDFEKLRKSDDPAKLQLADILDGITELKALVVSQQDRTDFLFNRFILQSRWLRITNSGELLTEAFREAVARQPKEDIAKRVADMSLTVEELLKVGQAQKEGNPDEQTE